MFRILGLFAARGVRTLCFKGLALAAIVYGDTSLRPVGDLDFLVHPRDFRRSADLLASESYTPASEMGHETHFTDARGDIIIDLQQGVTVEEIPFALEFESLWNDRGAASLHGGLLPVPSPEDTLILLAAKISEDWSQRRLQDRLLQICDIAELIRARPELNWRLTLEKASTRQPANALAGPPPCRGTLTPLPFTVSSKLAHAKMVQSLYAHICAQPFDLADTRPTSLEMTLFRLWVGERIRDRALLFATRIHAHGWRTPREIDKAFWQLPAAWTFLEPLFWRSKLLGRYAIRPFRQVLRSIRGTASKLRRHRACLRPSRRSAVQPTHREFPMFHE
jgi:hypothetical protein